MKLAEGTNNNNNNKSNRSSSSSGEIGRENHNFKKKNKGKRREKVQRDSVSLSSIEMEMDAMKAKIPTTIRYDSAGSVSFYYFSGDGDVWRGPSVAIHSILDGIDRGRHRLEMFDRSGGDPCRMHPPISIGRWMAPCRLDLKRIGRRFGTRWRGERQQMEPSHVAVESEPE